jgi:DNA-binding transcriptional MerR regulator
MLTIGRLASYAGVTIRAVRHYHQIGLLPEPERDTSGYRTYDADAVVRLIRIRTLAEAGVPLARVRELLDADPQTFAFATAEIDRQLRAQIRALQQHRRRIAQLGSGDSLALPMEVVDYLDRLRATGAPEAIIEPERDAWILMAARYPEELPAVMADKVTQLAQPEDHPALPAHRSDRRKRGRRGAPAPDGRPDERAVRTGGGQRGAGLAGRAHAGPGVHPPDGLVRRCFPPRRRAAAGADRRAWLDRVDSGRKAPALR